MRIAVTGAGGYIGSRLVRFLKNDFEVVPVVHSKKGLDNERIADVTDFESLNNALKNCDYVVHLAAISRPGACEEDKDLAYQINVQGTKNVLEACKENRVKGFLLASTIYVYGKSEKVKTEEDEPNPENWYAETKLMAEKTCEKYRKFFPVTILRFSFIYGPGQEGSVASDFIEKIRANNELEMLSSKEQVLGLLNVEDALNAIKKSIELKPDTVLNISPEKKTSLEELAGAIMKLLDKKVPVKDVPGKKASILASPGKARRILGWKAEKSLEHGIREIISGVQHLRSQDSL